MNIVLLGAPGSGKGTQAARIAREFDVVHVSTGDIFRQAVADSTELGLKAKEYMDKGELVPDDLVIGIAKERLARPDMKDGFMLDGFPRTVTQAVALDEALVELGTRLDIVIDLEVPDDELTRRLTGRMMCRVCGANYHKMFNPPSGDNCDSCGGELYQRDDDKLETVERRLKVYKEQTAPLIEYYSGTGYLHTIDGSRPPQEVFALIKEELASIGG